MSNHALLDLTAVEAERRPVKLLDGNIYYMATPDDLGPRAVARLAKMQHIAENVTAENFDEDSANEAEQAMTEAACIILPDAPREAVEQLPYMKRAKLVEVFVLGFAPSQETQMAVNPSTSGS